MDFLNNILGQGRQVQLVEEAIPILCNRLEHSTLSSDRRSAILGLKSFSKRHREMVVEYGLKALVGAFEREISNAVNIKAILETLILLMIGGEDDDAITRALISQKSRLQNGKYPSPLLMEDLAFDQFSLWIADEWTQLEKKVSLLIDALLENDDFHVKLYTLQLLECLVASRAERTKDCLLSIPTATSTIVSLLNDVHEPVRNEAILLLMAIVNRNFNIQKLVAFENTFETLFGIIEEEGGIRGSILVQDCLTLLTNLLQFNASNQKYFMETPCIPMLTRLLGEPLQETDSNDDNGEAEQVIWTDQRIQNVIISLEICRLFVSEDNEYCKLNQNRLHESGALFTTLKLLFSPLIIPKAIRSTALLTVADLISRNTVLQNELSKIDVPYTDPSLPSQLNKYDSSIPVPLLLLSWALNSNSVRVFDIRLSAAFCLHAYFRDNEKAKMDFLLKQTETYKSFHYSLAKPEEEEIGNNDQEDEDILSNHQNMKEMEAIAQPLCNLLATLMDYDAEINLNPYKVWFAAIILLYIFEDSPQSRETARSLITGNESDEEETMSCIQAIASLLTTTLTTTDPRIPMGYLMLLTVWFFEDGQAVNDFLSDQSIVRTILTFLTSNSYELTLLVHGMATILLGTVYEFSSKDSPISRENLHSLLVKSLGRDNYTMKVKQFNENPLVREFKKRNIFDIQKDSTGLPDVYFDKIYVDLLENNFLRLKKALFHDPSVEPRMRLSYEVFEEMDSNLASLRKKFNDETRNASEKKAQLESEIDSLTRKGADLEADSQKMSLKLAQVEQDYKILKEKHDSAAKELEHLRVSEREIQKLSEKHLADYKGSLKDAEQYRNTTKSLEEKISKLQEDKDKSEAGINKMSKELIQLTRNKRDSDAAFKRLQGEVDSLQKTLNREKTKSENTIHGLQKTNEDLSSQIASLQHRLSEISEKVGEDDKIIQQKVNEISRLEGFNRDLESKLQIKTSEHDSLVSLIKRYEHEIEKSKSEKDISKSSAEKLRTELSHLQDENSRLQSEIDSSKGSTRKEISALQNEVTELRSYVSKLEKHNSDSIEENSSLKRKIENDVRSYQDDKTTFEASILNLRNELSGKSGESEQKEAALGSLKEKCAQHESQLLSLEESYTKLKDSTKEKEMAQMEIEELKLTKQNNDAVIAGLKNDISKLTSDLEDQKAKLDHSQYLETPYEDNRNSSDSMSQKTKEKCGKTSELDKVSERDNKKSKADYLPLSDDPKRPVSQQEKKDLEKAIEDLTSDVKSKQSEIERLQLGLSSTKIDRENGERISSLESMITDSKNAHEIEVEELKKSSKDVSKKLSATREKVSSLEKQLEDKTQEFRLLEKESAKCKDQLKVMSKASNERKIEIDRLKSRIEGFEASKSESETLLNNERNAAANIKKSNESMRARIESLETNIENLQSESKTNDNEVKKCRATIEDKEKEFLQIELINKSLNHSVHNIQSLEAVNQDLRRRLTNNNGEIGNGDAQKEVKEDSSAGQDANEILQLRKKVSDLDSRLKEQTLNTVPRTELDDLMLVMSDMEEKLKKYKDRLRNEGEEVSSDESEDLDESGDSND